MVFVPDESDMTRLTRPEGWHAKDIPLPGFDKCDFVVNFIRVDNTQICYSFFAGLGVVTNTIIEFVIGPPSRFMLSEIVAHSRFFRNEDGLILLKSNSNRFIRN